MKMQLMDRKQENGFEEEYHNLISFIRCRLDIISTSLYLLEACCSENNLETIKYLKKINDEMESIRRFINMS